MKIHTCFINVILSVIGIIFFIIILCNITISINAKGRTFDRIEDMPYTKVGLLLATSPITPYGEHNYYFDYRIKATKELFLNKKIDYVIASGGDYSSKHNGCNEPISIRDSLIKQGIPDTVIILDYDGTRTLNSIVKAKKIYNLDSLTIISQQYHNERAIYLADRWGIKTIAYNAKTPDILNKWIKNKGREYLARVKMFIDLLLNVQPAFEDCNYEKPPLSRTI